MSFAYHCLVITALFFSFNVAGQENFQLKGSYQLDSSVKAPINYTLRWTEVNNQISGSYQDDYFSGTGSVSGEKSNLGRTFTVTFETSTKGVKSLTLLSSQGGSSLTGTTLPVGVIARDPNGTPLTTTVANSQLALVSPLMAQKQEEALCREGFGALAGYCGIYAGSITEEIDRGDQCNLLFAEAVRLELNYFGDVNLYLGVISEIVSIPIHRIGRIPSNPESLSVDVLSRHCGPISGTSFPADNCKRLHLVGKFSTRDTTRHFAGVYSITDELTNNVCRYSLSMDLR